jgi:hypothetical protein
VGRSLDEWQAKVAGLIRDEAGVDVRLDQIEPAIASALAEHTRRSPAELVVEVAGAGSPYLELPDGWVIDFSELLAVEHPARQNPPRFLCAGSWVVTRSPTDIAERQILLRAATPAAGEFVRLTFTGRWPTPTEEAGVDQVPDLDFDGVARLVAAYVCTDLATGAARDRVPALSGETTSAGDRAASLHKAADTLRSEYKNILFTGIVFA